MDDWETFLRRWRPDTAGYGEDVAIALDVPPTLRRYYAVAGRTPVANMHLVPPDELEVEDGWILFLHEEQGVYHFLLEPGGGGDVPVMLGVPDEPRRRLGAPLTVFLRSYVHFEATLCLQRGWGHVSLADLDRITAAMPELPLPPWPEPAPLTRFHEGGDLLGVVCDDGSDTLEVWAAARTLEPLAPILDVVDWHEPPS